MSKVTVALASFVAGISSILIFPILFGSHTSTSAQGVTVRDAEPKVPPLTSPMSGITFRHETQPLDGVDCTGCVFSDVTLTYGGGGVRLVDPKFSGTIRVQFKGAAANALATAAFLQAALQNQKPPAPTLNTPTMKTAKLADVFVADLVSPYGQK
jgi:hypothetical protein